MSILTLDKYSALMLKMIFVGRNKDRNQGAEENIIIYQQDITAGVKMPHTDKKKFVRDIVLLDMNKDCRK